VIPIDHTYDPDAMRQAGRDIEKTVLVEAIRLVADDKVFINGNKTVVFDN
jgi:formyltetrahydrofolate deformylase